MSDKFCFYASIDNRTSEHVTFLRDEFTHGGEGQTPAADVPPQHLATNAFFAQGTAWNPYGTEGTAYFQVGVDTMATFSLYWQISSEPGSTNQASVTPSSSVHARVQGDPGSAESVSVTVIVTEE